MAMRPTDAVPAHVSGPSGQHSAGLPRLGFISTGGEASPISHAFREGLWQAGEVEGQTFILESRYGEGQNDRLPALAAELVALPVDAIAVIGAVTVRAVRRASATMPLLFTIVLDPVADGLVRDMQRPGGATSGVTNFDPAQARAQIRLLKQVIPDLERLAIIGDSGVPDLLNRANIDTCEAEAIRPQLLLLGGDPRELEHAFAAIRGERAQAVLGLYVPTVIFVHARRLVAMATAAGLPTMLPADWETYAPLLTFGSSVVDGARLMGQQAARVITGTPPGDLPVEVVTRHRLTVNQQVARAIGMTIPPDVLARADQMIG